MEKVSNKVTLTILSMSLLTVMAGAAIAPALGIIKEHFASSPQLLVQFIVSVPALFIILTNLFFLRISRRFNTRTIAIAGLSLYVLAGAGCFLASDIYVLLALRALLGVSVGLVMPLSTGLLAYYFPPEEQARLMGLSAAMNQLGGVVATLLAGLLAQTGWNYSFLTYLLGLIALAMVYRWLPVEHLDSSNKRGKAFEPRQLLKFHPSVIGMLLLMLIFFIFPTNFAVTAFRQTSLSVTGITLIMVGLDIVAFFVGIVFEWLMHTFRRPVKYFAPCFFLVGYLLFVIADGAFFLILGSAVIGVANGVGVPYLNTIASIKGGRNSATTVMPLLSAALYLGQFVSPIIVTPLAQAVFGAGDSAGAYKVGVIACLIFMYQVWSTRHFQSLPPTDS
ncbi:MAG: MFS transporter [Prevotella sp.]|uniref:MFS transporter n=1 Tax=Prevotella sp. TaxID=59823 RepID=UPI002A34E5BB|nr:MFS transporter [Prevotella sp.]MDD7317152.1 MFS transporter [Prevotellaceae bacterium]MDY4019756.1 MFS transporter [Prevotella sp.]